MRHKAAALIRRTAVPALVGAAILMSGCAGPESSPPASAGTVSGPVAEVSGSTMDWDQARYPERVPRDDYLGGISSQYDVWAPGSSWRISGDGWTPEEDVVITFARMAAAGEPEAAAGDPVTLKADSVGQFAGAYALPKDTKPGESFLLRASSPSSGRTESTLLQVVDNP